jgi:hypothetical protein
MSSLWMINAFLGALLALQVANIHMRPGSALHLSIIIVFMEFSIGSCCMVYLYSTDNNVEDAALQFVWGSVSLINLCLLTPILLKHFYVNVKRNGEYYIDVGISGMILGMMFTSSQNSIFLPIIGMTSMVVCYSGFKLRSIL